jgi:hypothetical protein
MIEVLRKRHQGETQPLAAYRELRDDFWEVDASIAWGGGEMRNADKILIEIYEEKRPFGRHNPA